MDSGQKIMLAQSPKYMNQEQQLGENQQEKLQQLEQEPLQGKRAEYKSFLKFLLLIINVSLSCFYFGYTILYLSVIDFTTVMFIFDIQMEQSTAQGFLTFCVPLGGLFGSLSSSYFISKLSRRQTLLLINLAAFFFGILLYFAGFKVYVLIRFGQGMCAGIFSAIVPLIIKEITPFELSGFFGVFQQIFITLGIFMACFVSFILSLITGDQTGLAYWKWLFGFPLLTILLQTSLLLTYYDFQPPKYLVDKNREDEARAVLRKFYYEDSVENVIRNYKADGNKDQSGQTTDNPGSGKFSVTKKVSIHLAILQQLVGITAVATYGRQLAQGSLQSIKSFFPSLLNLVQVVFAAISSVLLTKYGRKTILQFGTAGSAISNIIIAIGFWINQSHPTLSLVLILTALFYYMGNFNVSLGPIVWMYIPQIVEPSFLPFSTMVNWSFSALSVLLFPIIKARLPGDNPAPMFLFFALWSLGSFFANKKYVIETKGKTERQIKEAYARLEQGKANV